MHLWTRLYAIFRVAGRVSDCDSPLDGIGFHESAVLFRSRVVRRSFEVR